VIPVRNGAATLAAQLAALASATKPEIAFDVIVADNGSTDGTARLAQSFAAQLPLKVIDARAATGPGAVRNVGVRASNSEWLLFCDADDEVDHEWLVEMVAALAAGHEIVGGPISYTRLNGPHIMQWRGARVAGVEQALGFHRFAHSSNLGVTRELFDKLGGFDDWVRPAAEDIDFSWRAQLAGHTLHEAGSAVVHYRLRQSLRDLWNQAVGYGRSEVLLFVRYREYGLRRRPAMALLHDAWWLMSRLPFAWAVGRRGAWIRRAGQFTGRLVGSAHQRTLWW
jgi:glycosyltransferase involved in cell wall biosynthesis